MYKPSTAYRKSAPPKPDFCVAVVDALDVPEVPGLEDLGGLLAEMDVRMPGEIKASGDGGWFGAGTGTGTGTGAGQRGRGRGRVEGRLKTGLRDCVIAVVDGGVVSYLRVGEVGSGRERVSEERGVRRGGKGGRGGRGGGRGAGRGRGRGK